MSSLWQSRLHLLVKADGFEPSQTQRGWVSHAIVHTPALRQHELKANSAFPAPGSFLCGKRTEVALIGLATIEK